MIEINNKKLCESCFAETEEEKCPHCGYSKEEYIADQMVLPLGTRLNDKIIIGKVMGKGGFGITYLGYDLRMEKTIAVKEYYPNGIAYRSQSGTEVLVADPKSNETFDKGTEKFYSEAEMVAQFNGNPNIVGVYDYFRANNTVYLIMEYLNGITLKNYVKKHGQINDGQALFVMDKIAAALSITHSAGVLHRDISPDNIMVCLDGKIKLIDFGAARQIVAESSSNLTVVMKPGYTPIEQYTKKGRQGAWTDIYALGASIYFAMTGTVIDDPYERMDSDDEFAENRHNINTTLWNVIKKCTMINASDRYGSAIELRKALSGVSSPVKPEPLPLSSEDMKATEEEAAKEAAEASANLIASTTGPIERFTEGVEGTTEEPTVQQEGYNPDENVYIKTEKEKKPLNKKLLLGAIGGAAAVIAIVVGIVLFVNRPESELPVNVDVDGTTTTAGNAAELTSDAPSAPGAPAQKLIFDENNELWASSHAISKETLQSFGGDVKITLGIATINNTDSIFEHTFFRHTIAPRSGEDDVIISLDNGYVNGNNEWDIYEQQSTFVFTVTKARIDAMEGDLFFQPKMIELNSAVIETYTGVGDDVKTVTFNEQYPGDWGRHETYISKEDLMSYGGDVRVEVEYDGLYSKHYIKTINEDWDPVIVDVPNMMPDDDETVYVLYKQPFVFHISRELIEGLSDRGLGFQTEGLVVKSVRLRTPDYGKEGNGGNSSVQQTGSSYYKEIEFSDKYQGDWAMGAVISKEDLQRIGGDVKVTLYVQGTDTTPCIKLIDYSDDGEWLDGSYLVSDDDLVLSTDYGDNEDHKYRVKEGEGVFAFTITADSIAKLKDQGLGFQVNHVIIKSATLSPVRTLRVDSEFPGNWAHSVGIPKDSLSLFTKDIKVTLMLECVEAEKEYDQWAGGDVYYHHLNIVDDNDKFIEVNAYNITTDGIYRNFYLGASDESKGTYKFEFILTQDSLEKLSKYIFFQGNNLYVTSATFEYYDPAEDAVSADAVTVSLQNENGISKSRLQSFGGDVKITLSIDGEFIDGDGMIHFSAYDENDDLINVYCRNLEIDPNNYCIGYYETAPETITLVISAQQIAELGDQGLYFFTSNARITSAALEPA